MNRISLIKLPIFGISLKSDGRYSLVLLDLTASIKFLHKKKAETRERSGLWGVKP